MRRLIVSLSAAAIAAAGAIADGYVGRAGIGDRPRGRRVRRLPSGAVTFLFSDLEGSTRLVKALRERYPQVLAEHRKLVRAAIASQAGYEVDTQGDAFFVAFASAKQAVLCALEIQRALARHLWPAGAAVRVRIGIHTGQAVPVEGGYTGLAVHRAARICAVTRGGQVLVSQATQTLIEDEEEEPGFRLVDVGERTLKDLDRPVRLFELAEPGLESVAPQAARQPGLGSALAPKTRSHRLAPAPRSSGHGCRVAQLGDRNSQLVPCSLVNREVDPVSQGVGGLVGQRPFQVTQHDADQEILLARPGPETADR